MSDTCTITISGNGKPVTAELPKKTANALEELATLLGGAPRRPGELSAEAIALRSKRREEAENGGKSLLSELGSLSDEQITLVGQYVRLLRFGDKGLSSDENWVLELINELLYECIYDGIGGALASGPGKALQGLAYTYGNFQGTIDQIREATKEYRELFRDPVAEAETAATIARLDNVVAQSEANLNSLRKTVRRALRSKKRSARERGASGARRTRARARQT